MCNSCVHLWAFFVQKSASPFHRCHMALGVLELHWKGYRPGDLVIQCSTEPTCWQHPHHFLSHQTGIQIWSLGTTGFEKPCHNCAEFPIFPPGRGHGLQLLCLEAGPVSHGVMYMILQIYRFTIIDACK